MFEVPLTYAGDRVTGEIEIPQLLQLGQRLHIINRVCACIQLLQRETFRYFAKFPYL